MAWRDFINKTDSWKVFLFDFEPAREIESLAWTQCGSPNTAVWYASFSDGFASRVAVNGVEFVEEFSITACQATVNTFYYDPDNSRLYVHVTDGDDPSQQTVSGTYDYIVLAYFWLHYANTAFESDPIVLPRVRDVLSDGGFEWWDSATTLNKWTESVTGASTINREGSTQDEGAYCVRLDTDASNNLVTLSQNFRLAPGYKCRFVVRYKTTNGKDGAFLMADSGSNVYLHSDGAWGSVTGVALPASSAWTDYVLEFDAHSSYVNYQLFFGFGGDWVPGANSSSLYIDSVHMYLYREDNYYEPLTTNSMPDIVQSIQFFHLGTVTMESGSAEFVNDGYWYRMFTTYLWHNKDAKIRFGERGAPWYDYEQVFYGVIADVTANETIARVDITDNKALTYINVNPHVFDIDTYPWLEDGAEGKPIPVIYGEFAEVVPVCVDITTYKYKVADHELEDIPTVYSNGVALTETTDYTLDLANGEFTLEADPVDAFITCHVKGKKCDRIGHDSAGVYSENVADIIYDMLRDYGGFYPTDLDQESLLDLQGSRSQDHHLYIDQNTPIYNAIRLLQASALFHFIPKTDGTFGTYRFAAGVDANTVRLTNEEIEGFNLTFESESVYKVIQLLFAYDPSQSHWEQLEITLNATEWRHRRRDTLTIQTSLRSLADTEELGAYYTSVLQNPVKTVGGTLPSSLFAARPGDKIIITKIKTLDDGSEYTVLDEEPYRIVSLRKQMRTGKVAIEAWDDLQASGGTFCEVCYHCQTCITTEDGTCSVCYSCEDCVSGQCATCQVCYYCQYCDTGECSSCQTCDSCQDCDTCQTTQCSSCVTCQSCFTSQGCGGCEDCVMCQICYSCQDYVPLP